MLYTLYNVYIFIPEVVFLHCFLCFPPPPNKKLTCFLYFSAWYIKKLNKIRAWWICGYSKLQRYLYFRSKKKPMMFIKGKGKYYFRCKKNRPRFYILGFWYGVLGISRLETAGHAFLNLLIGEKRYWKQSVWCLVYSMVHGILCVSGVPVLFGPLFPGVICSLMLSLFSCVLLGAWCTLWSLVYSMVPGVLSGPWV